MSHRGLPLLMALCAVLSSCTGETPAPEAAKPRLNVLIIVSDALRADHLGCYGYKRNTSPMIDSLAREGMLFERAHSHSSFTRESVSALMTGVPPAANASGTGWYAMPDPDRVQLDALFNNAGYVTGFLSNQAIFEDAPFGTHCAVRETLPMENGEVASTRKLAARAESFIHENRDRPFMAYVHFLNPHYPYKPAPEYFQRVSSAPYPTILDVLGDVRPNVPALTAGGFGPGETRFEDIVACYDAEIATVDDGVRAIVEALRETGTLDRTLIVFTSDHGEEFLDHGFVEHSWSLYDEVVRVPLILWRPALIPAGRETARVSHCDLYPTLVKLAGLACDRTDLYGTALFDVAGGAAVFHAPAKPIFMEMLLETRLQLHAVVMDDHKYIAAPHWLTPDQCSALSKTHRDILMAFKAGKIPAPPVWGPPEHEALYNLAADPGEKSDLSKSDPAMLDKMRGALEAYRKGCPEKYFQGPPVKDEKGLSDAEKERLKGLEYLGGGAGAPKAAAATEVEGPENTGSPGK